MTPPAKSAGVAVCLPTTGRPQQARACIKSLLEPALLPDVDLMVIAAVPSTDRDTYRALYDLLDYRAFHLVNRRAGTTAVQGWNVAARCARAWGAEWYVLGADDIVFHPGWLTAALQVAAATQAEVIGLSDGGHTDLDQYAPHYMLTRGFADRHLGGCIAPAVYQSWWFDREVCQRAQSLGLYAPAPDSVLEHRHPDWGTAPLDATYRLGQPLRDADKALYESRRQEWEAVHA